jgi:AcrR family transcriptional regulator
MDAKRRRIFDAAAGLFAEHGFVGVTTRAISERADVAEGTLFRYAETKAELLLMVYNVEFGGAISAGVAAAERLDDPTDAVFALVRPVLERNQKPANALHYQRELFYGSGKSQHRAEGLELVARLEQAIATTLLQAAGDAGEATLLAAERASRLVFAGLHLALAQPSTHAHVDKPPAPELRAQVDLVVRGFLDAVRTSPDRQHGLAHTFTKETSA